MQVVVDFIVVLLHVLWCCDIHAAENTPAGQLSLGLTACEESFPVVKTVMEERLHNERRVRFTFDRGIRLMIGCCRAAQIGARASLNDTS